MKVTVDPRTLRDAIKIVRRIIPRTTTLPVLSHVLLTVGDGLMTVTADNLEARACQAIPAITAESGCIALPARVLFDVLGAFPGQASLESASGKPAVRVTGDGIDFTMPAIEASEFPANHEIGERDGWLSMNAQTLKTMVTGAIRAAAPGDARPVLAGLRLLADSDGLTIAAADGFRLRTQTIAAWPGKLDTLISWRTLREIVSSLKRDDVVSMETFARKTPASRTVTKDGKTETIEYTEVVRTFRLSTAGGWWQARTVDGQYPDFQRIIPKADTIKTRATVKVDDLRRAVQLGIALGGQMIRLDISGENLTASVDAFESASGSIIMPANVRGTAMTLALGSRYLRDALVEISGDVLLECVGPASPMTIRASEGPGARWYVMPMRAES